MLLKKTHTAWSVIAGLKKTQVISIYTRGYHRSIGINDEAGIQTEDPTI